MAVAAVLPVSAANQSFAFNLGNTDTTYNTYWGAYNTKVYASNPGTVRTSYNNAPGAGFSFVLKCTEPYDGAIVGPGPMVIATSGQWISGAGIKYLNYLSGKNVVGRAYYVAGRIDNDYHNTYSCNGYFNSDRVS